MYARNRTTLNTLADAEGLEVTHYVPHIYEI